MEGPLIYFSVKIDQVPSFWCLVICSTCIEGKSHYSISKDTLLIQH